jgi:hypothetical protein
MIHQIIQLLVHGARLSVPLGPSRLMIRNYCLPKKTVPENDKINGNDENDLLSGGNGNYELTGGIGADKFDCGDGKDKIPDFRASDGDKKTNDKTLSRVN